MRFIDGLKMRRLGKEFILIPESSELVDFNKMISLNSTAAFLYEAVKDMEFDTDTLKNIILENYEVAEDVAFRDSENLLKAWVEAGIVVE